MSYHDQKYLVLIKLEGNALFKLKKLFSNLIILMNIDNEKILNLEIKY